jgi:hypothetical protein
MLIDKKRKNPKNSKNSLPDPNNTGIITSPHYRLLNENTRVPLMSRQAIIGSVEKRKPYFIIIILSFTFFELPFFILTME